jgi:hypothetical protein
MSQQDVTELLHRLLDPLPACVAKMFFTSVTHVQNGDDWEPLHPWEVPRQHWILELNIPEGVGPTMRST